MLFTDSDIVSQKALAQVDSEVDLVASTSKRTIVIEGTGSICRLAWQECGQMLLSAQQVYGAFYSQGALSANHLSAIHNIGSPRAQARCRLNQVVAHNKDYANSDSPLQQWMQYQALYLLFRDAAVRLASSKDRYDEKSSRYSGLARARWDDIRAQGLPIVGKPLEAPGALHGFNSGTWSESNLSSASGGASAAQSVYVAITWYDSSAYASQSSKGNGESGASQILPFTIPLNQLLSVDITSLNPPTGVMDPVGVASATFNPLNATHWNIYVGQTDDALWLQRAGIAIATKSAALTTDPVYSGNPLLSGQFPDQNIVFQNTVSRG